MRKNPCLAIIQARLGSTRFPRKVLQTIGGRTLIEILIARLRRASRLDDIVVATTDAPRDDELEEHLATLGCRVFRGSENDVLDRYYQAALRYRPGAIVRITGDCPLIDPGLVDRVIDAFYSSGVDYASNVEPPTFPDGLDTEVMTFPALERAWREASEKAHREHVTPYIRSNDTFSRTCVRNDVDLSAERWTVDEPNDYAVVSSIINHFHSNLDFTWQDVVSIKSSHPELFSANASLKRNEGADMSTGQKLWKRACRVIPGGNMLLSKRAEMFLPEKWPAYFSRAKGCRVWDLDDTELIDMSLMGVGTNTLGYGNPEVDEAVAGVIARGNLSTLNCPEEVYLAERLVELHPWAAMVRFARSGGEANAIAVRIARAASGKDVVAFCGYHGWHDWYLSANLADDANLDGHLLPGLEPRGVPRSLRGTVFPFNFNDFDQLDAIVRGHDVGVIKMEVTRNVPPEPGFLEKVRELASKRGIVLVFDECTSGFRQSFGGIHKIYGVEPDMAIFGKTLGNGYAITAAVGRREIMESAQSTFISSTFWTERIGPTAGLKTLAVMERVRSWETITETGRAIQRRWRELAERHGVPITLSGIPALASFTFPPEKHLAYKTLITQEMLKKGYLASTAVYVCTEHTPEIIDAYFDALDPVFGLIRTCEDGRDVSTLLEGPVCHGGFRRLN